MRHRIVVLGAGYAGASIAKALARHLRRDDVDITVVNAESTFVERIRLHELTVGQEPRRHDLATMFAGTGIRLRQATVTAVDADARTVTVTEADGTDRLAYDSLVYALGSTVDDGGVPGVLEHAFHIAQRPAALRLRERLRSLPTGRVLVVGGNLTAIEGATEIAESRPELDVSIVTSGELGGWLSATARRHLLRAVDRFGIELHENTTIEQVTETGATATDGNTFSSDVTVWSAGFTALPIAAEAGLDVAEDGRIVVDRMMRSVSHPEIYAIGDSGYAIDKKGRPLPMSCASAGFTRMQATAAMVGDLTGHRIAKTPLVYLANCISLGRNDAIVQVVDGDARAKSWSLRGRTAARIRSLIPRGTVWAAKNPTYRLPTRRRRLSDTTRRGSVTSHPEAPVS